MYTSYRLLKDGELSIVTTNEDFTTGKKITDCSSCVEKNEDCKENKNISILIKTNLQIDSDILNSISVCNWLKGKEDVWLPVVYENYDIHLKKINKTIAVLRNYLLRIINTVFRGGGVGFLICSFLQKYINAACIDNISFWKGLICISFLFVIENWHCIIISGLLFLLPIILQSIFPLIFRYFLGKITTI